MVKQKYPSSSGVTGKWYMIGGRSSDTCKIVYFGWVYGFDDKVNNL
jgi:hypothetical protein